MNPVVLLFALLLLGVAVDALRLGRDEPGRVAAGRFLAVPFGLLALGGLVASVVAGPSPDRPAVHGLGLLLAAGFAARSLLEGLRERDTPRLAVVRFAQGLALAVLALVFFSRLARPAP